MNTPIEPLKEFYLLDYKGKFTIIADEEDDTFGYVGRISRAEVIDEATERIEDAKYYGVPAYIGDDAELKKIYND